MSAARSDDEGSGSSRRATEQDGWVVMRRNLEFASRDAVLDGEDVVLVHRTPPRASFLGVRLQVLPTTGCLPVFGFVHSVDESGLVLFAATDGSAARKQYAVCNLNKRSVYLLPSVPPSLSLQPSSSRLAVIADPSSGGQHYLVAQLHAAELALLVFGSLSRTWHVKGIAASSDQGVVLSSLRPNTVISHGGQLVFVDLELRHLLLIDPFMDGAAPRLVALPGPSNPEPRARFEDMGRIRLVMPSSGRLIYAEIDFKGDMASLSTWSSPDDLFGDGNPWLPLHTVPLADIKGNLRDDSVWLAAGQVPALGLVHPLDKDIVFLFLGDSLFAVDLQNQKVIDSAVFLHQGMESSTTNTSQFVWAWQPPQAPATESLMQPPPRTTAYKLKKCVKLAYSWVRDNPHKVVEMTGQMVEQGGMLFLPVSMRPGGVAVGKGIQQVGKALGKRQSWSQALREDAEYEDRVVQDFDIRCIKSEQEAGDFLEEWRGKGKPSNKYRIDIPSSLSAITVKSVRQIFEENQACHLLEESVMAVKVGDEHVDADRDIEGYVFVAI